MCFYPQHGPIPGPDDDADSGEVIGYRSATRSASGRTVVELGARGNEPIVRALVDAVLYGKRIRFRHERERLELVGLPVSLRVLSDGSVALTVLEGEGAGAGASA